MQLISQLSMIIKADYVDGWKPGKKANRVDTIDDFFARVVDIDGVSGYDDFSSPEQAIKAVKAVFRVLKAHVSAGEIEDLQQILPKRLVCPFE